MPAPSAISVVKVISTCGLGLLSGYAIASPLLITPTISSLSTRTTASKLTDRQIISSRMTAIAASSVAALNALIFTLSPSGARHPYLLYASVLSLSAAVTLETFGTAQVRKIGEMSDGEVNPDAVDHAFDNLRIIGSAIAAILTSGFAISVIGNYGDFY